MQSSKENRNPISKADYDELHILYEKAKALVDQKLKIDKNNVNIWKFADEQLQLIANNLETYQIPRSEEKEKINLGTMLAKTFDSPEASQELAPLFELINKYRYLGLKDIDQKEALNLYTKLLGR